jgi:5-methylcytosine-specific restriction endonuclease McrA
MNNLTFLEAFKLVIRECDYENTYKMAWAKSLVELSKNKKNDSDEIVKITLEEIAIKFIKYYWNQTVFFDLIQGSNPTKPPKILSDVKDMIAKYYKYVDNKIPVFFERAEGLLEDNLTKEYNSLISKTIRTLKENVSYRFINYKGKQLTQLYTYHINTDELYMLKENMKQLDDNSQDLYDLINYRWTLILETFNSSPRINKKVRIIDEKKITRKNLNVFNKYLDLENPEHYCFHCGKKINKSELARDHIIPWSYLYSDDLWNIVYCCKSCNSKKGNTTPDEDMIEKVKIRNEKLLKLAPRKSKPIKELEYAIEKDLVDKFFIACKS